MHGAGILRFAKNSANYHIWTQRTNLIVKRSKKPNSLVRAI
jgi:hypothetical protein